MDQEKVPPATPPEPPAADAKADKPKAKPAKQEPEHAPLLVMSSSPHIHRDQDVPRIMRDVIVALIPATLVGCWFFGLGAVKVILLAIAGCLFFEWVYMRLVKRPSRLGDGSAVLTGLLLAMNLPAGSPWWMVLVGSLVAIILGKQIYGGLGYNPFNPALVARVFLLISFPVQMTTWPKPATNPLAVDATTTATPLGAIREYVGLGNTLPLPADLSTPLWQLVVGLRGGCIGEVSVAMLLLGGLYLLWKGHIRWQIPVAFIGTVFAISGLFWFIDPGRYASPLLHVFSAGLFLGAFFMATDMVTSPVTRKGMFVFGFGCGLITAVIRLWGGYPEGVSFAILLMNAATPLIDRYTRPKVFGTGRKLYQEAKAA